MQAQAIGKARPLLAPSSGAEAATLAATLHPLGPATDLEALIAPYARSIFQNPHWLGSWLKTMPDPQIEKAWWVDVREAGGEPVLALPLIFRREGGLGILSSPDLGVTDYNPPLLGRAEVVAAHDREDLWSALRGALPPADLLRLKRMPAEVGEVPNPLARHSLAVCARTSGWVVNLPESWDAYVASLTPKMREKLGKCRRRFLRQPGARFVVTEDVDQALAWLDRFDDLQRQRIEEKGAPYILDREPYASFYRTLARSGLPEKRIAMAALMAGDEIVAVNFAVREGSTAVYLRVANQFGSWAPMAPGLLVTEHLMRHLHDDGVRTFDFAMGDYAYKRRFGAERLPLVTVEIALTARAMPGATARYLYRRLAAAPQMRHLREWWRGRRPAQPGCD